MFRLRTLKSNRAEAMKAGPHHERSNGQTINKDENYGLVSNVDKKRSPTLINAPICQAQLRHNQVAYLASSSATRHNCAYAMRFLAPKYTLEPATLSSGT